MSGLVILAALVFEISYRKIDRHWWKLYPATAIGVVNHLLFTIHVWPEENSRWLYNNHIYTKIIRNSVSNTYGHIVMIYTTNW